MLLLDIPSSLFCELLSDWLDLCDIGKLDSSICNVQGRGPFLQALQDRATVSLGHPSKDIEDGCLFWLFMRKLKLLSLSISDPDVNLTADDCSVFRSLQYLDIYYRNRLRLIGEACAEGLKVLVLRGCEIIIEEAIQMVSQFRCLHTLEIGELTKLIGRKRTKPTLQPNRSLHRAMLCGATLKTFICNWSGLSSIYVQQIVSACRHLVRLELTVDALTDEVIYTFVQYCQEIRSLRLLRCACTTADGIVALAALSKLELLDLNGTVGVTNDSIIPIIANNPALHTINLRHAVAINSLAVMKIAATCPGLTSLDVAYCTFVKDDALALIANKCRALQDLQVCGCEFITDMSMLRLANMCPQLTSINIKDCNLVTKATVDAFAFSGVRPYKKKLR